MDEDIKIEEDDLSKNQNSENKMKNLISISVLLFGMLLGSLFIDLSQLIKKDGFSSKKLNQSDIFEANGKTWVAYGEPAVGAKVITDEDCDDCNVDEILIWMRRILPTIATEKVEYDSDEGKKLIQDFSIKTLPSFVFDSQIKSTDFYAQAGVLFEEKDNQFILRTQDIGIPVGKYVELPKINEGDAISGSNKDAKVRVVIFSDFQCPYCKLFHTVLRDAMKNYKDSNDIYFDYKFLPLDTHAQANDAALAATCALEQGKFWEYSDKLYSDQVGWSNNNGINKFKGYAKILGLKQDQFNQCLDSKKYQDKINADVDEANNFAVSGTPTVFVNDQVQSGSITSEQFKSIIEKELAK